jgi:hypothetical protein
MPPRPYQPAQDHCSISGSPKMAQQQRRHKRCQRHYTPRFKCA